MQLLDDLKEKRGYWEMKVEALNGTLWRSRFVRAYGPVERQTMERMFVHVIYGLLGNYTASCGK
jgi:hypothetical protein